MTVLKIHKFAAYMFAALALQALLGLSCSQNPVQCPPPATRKPQLFIDISDTAVTVGDTLSINVFTDSASLFLWNVFRHEDTVPLLRDTTAFDRWAHVFTDGDTGNFTVVVTGLDQNDSIESQPCSAFVQVSDFHLVASITRDTTITAGDSFHVALDVDGAGAHSFKIAWLKGFGDSAPDTTTKSGVTLTRKESGLFPIIAWAFTECGRQSNRDTCEIRVRRPRAALAGDTSGAPDQTIHFSATIDSGGEQTWQYIWSADSVELFSADPTYEKSWGAQDTGVHCVRVRALSAAGITTAEDTLCVHITGRGPSLLLPADTVVSALDTLVITAQAADEDGEIRSIIWRTAGFETGDTTDSGSFEIFFQGQDSVSVIAEVVDNHGYSKADTISVRFNAPPFRPALTAPGSDTIIVHLYDSSFYRGAINMRWRARDPDGAADTVGYRVYLKTNADSARLVYEGFDTAAAVAGVDTGLCAWRIEAIDRFGHEVADSGDIAIKLEKTICFAGHSIVVGIGGQEGAGGFRAKVLSRLREKSGAGESLRPVGPLSTGFLEPERDDRCIGVIGEVAPHIWQLLEYTRPEVNADMWVVYLGVNGAYSVSERDYLFRIIDALFARNPDANVAVVNGFPYQYYPAITFNSWLYQEVRMWRQKGGNIAYIDAYSAFVKDGVLDAGLVPDGIHPNQSGYDILAEMIADTLLSLYP